MEKDVTGRIGMSSSKGLGCVFAIALLLLSSLSLLAISTPPVTQSNIETHNQMDITDPSSTIDREGGIVSWQDADNPQTNASIISEGSFSCDSKVFSPRESAQKDSHNDIDTLNYAKGFKENYYWVIPIENASVTLYETPSVNNTEPMATIESVGGQITVRGHLYHQNILSIDEGGADQGNGAKLMETSHPFTKSYFPTTSISSAYGSHVSIFFEKVEIRQGIDKLVITQSLSPPPSDWIYVNNCENTWVTIDNPNGHIYVNFMPGQTGTIGNLYGVKISKISYGDQTTLITPAKHVRVEVWDAYDSLGDIHFSPLNSGYTDDNGYFSVIVDNQESDGEDIYVKFFTWSSDAGQVLNALLGSIYAAQTDTVWHVQDGILDIDDEFGATVIPDSDNSAWIIYDDLYIGHSFAENSLGFTMPSVTMHWNHINALYGSHYNNIYNYIWIGRLDGEFRNVHLHEYAHFVMDMKYSDDFPTTTSPHNFRENYDKSHAWAEGYASFFGISAGINAGVWSRYYVSSIAGYEDLENAPTWTGGETNEGSVALALYDMIDDGSQNTYGLFSDGVDDDPYHTLAWNIDSVMGISHQKSIGEWYADWKSIMSASNIHYAKLCLSKNKIYTFDSVLINNPPNGNSLTVTSSPTNGIYRGNIGVKVFVADADSEDGSYIITEFQCKKTFPTDSEWKTFASSGQTGWCTGTWQSDSINYPDGEYQIQAVITDGITGVVDSNPKVIVPYAAGNLYIDNTPPVLDFQINDNAVYTASTSVHIDILSSYDNGAGMNQADRWLSNDGVNWYTFPETGPVAWTLLSGDGTKTVSFKGMDVVGNVQIVSKTICLDTTPPIYGPSPITINGGAEYTTTTLVTLTLSASDANPMQMRFSNDGTSWSTWEKYAQSKTWTLTSGSGTKTVYFQVKDIAGSIPSPSTASDSITLRQLWTGMAIPQDNFEFNFNTILTPYGIGYHIDSEGYSDCGFNMFGYLMYDFKVQEDGTITVRGFFRQSDAFGPGLSNGRSMVNVYVLDSSNLEILASASVLTYENPKNSWIEVEKTISGPLLTAGKIVKIGVGRPDAWELDWRLTAEWACIRAIDPNYYGTTVPPGHQFHFTTPTAEHPAYTIDTVGITGDYGFDMMGYSEQYFAVQGGLDGSGGTITISGDFLQFDTGFGPEYPLEGRRMLQIYALDPIDLHIISQASVLDYQDDINTWYQVTEFTLGGLDSYVGDYVRIGIGRPDAWDIDWSLTASWSWKSVDQVIQSPTSSPDSSVSGTTSNGWYVSKVEVTLSALSASITSVANGQSTSAHASDSEIYYCIDGGTWELYKKPIKNLKDGIHTIDYYSIDENGIGSNLQTLVLMIDTSGPTRPGVPAWIPGDETDGVFELTWAPSADPLSGVQSYILQQQKDDGKWVTIASDISETTCTIGSEAPLTPGTYCYRVCAVDVAGNVGHWANSGSIIIPD